MKKLFFKSAICLTLLIPCYLQSLQAQNQIAGTVQDAIGKPLSYATVLLLNAADSSLVRGAFSSEQGAFQFDGVSAGTYLCGFSMLGFEQAYSKAVVLTEKTNRIDLEPVVLQDNSNMLSEVAVVAKRPFLEQKIDRTIVNVANSITNAGGTALQVLQRSPGVQVNALTKTISLAGKEGVVIMINGKISRLPAEAVVDMLSGMNSDNIDHIELIHTPPANFEAEGNAGIINIVLKSTGDAGFNGGYSAKVGYGHAEKYGGGAYFNYRKNKVNIFGNYDYNLNNNPQVFINYRRVEQAGDVFETKTNADRPHTPTALQRGQIGADFQVSKKTVVGFLGTYFDRNWRMPGAESTAEYLKNGQLESQVRMPNAEVNHNRSLAGNLNLTHQFTNNQRLDLDADYVSFDITNPSDYDVFNLDAAGNTNSSYQLRIRKDMPVRISVAKADYSIDLGESKLFETGVKFTRFHFDNRVAVDQHNPGADWAPLANFTSVSQLDEQVFGAFGSFSFKILGKTEIKAGLRYEYTNSMLDSAETENLVDRQYGNWFPSLFISRKLVKDQTLNFSYSRRTTRPTMRQLSPGFVFFDPTTFQSGNTALVPAFTDALKLDYGLKAWHFSLSYSLTKNPIGNVTKVDPTTGVQSNGPQNLTDRRQLSANLSFPLHPTKFWEMNSNLYTNATELNFELEGKTLKLQNVDYGFNLTNTFILPKKFTLEVSGYYESPNYWGIAKFIASGSFNLGVEKDLGPNWGKLRFNVNDIFETDDWAGETRQPEIGLFVNQGYFVAERTFMLSWTNTFGNNKLKSSRQRQTGSAEEMKRI